MLLTRGDVGFTSRWTSEKSNCDSCSVFSSLFLQKVEITNNSSHYTIPLVVGRRIAQIVFVETGPTLDTSYEQVGKYQTASDMSEVKKRWRPQDMLPKCYLDREVKEIEGKIWKML